MRNVKTDREKQGQNYEKLDLIITYFSVFDQIRKDQHNKYNDQKNTWWILKLPGALDECEFRRREC